MTLSTLTCPDGPVVAGERTLRALVAIRRQKLQPQLYGRVVIDRCNFEALADVLPAAPPMAERRGQPSGSTAAAACDRRGRVGGRDVAPGAGAARVAGSAGRARQGVVKLSFIKSEGTVSILVTAYRRGLLSAVPPMVKALEKLGFGDVLPPPEQLEAMWRALD